MKGTRIVSLLPSATEMIYALGLGDSLVGVSHECDYPEGAKAKPKMIEPIFDTTKLNSERIDALVIENMRQGKSIYRIRFEELKRANPDLIITQELCHVCAIGATDVLEAANRLGKPVKVLSLNPHTLGDVQDDIRKVAGATDRQEEAGRVITRLNAKAERIKGITKGASKTRVFCAEWLKPVMNAGHWIPEILEYAGGVDELASKGQPSTYVDWNRVLDYDPEAIVLMPCGFSTPRTIREATQFLDLPNAKQLSAVRNDRVYATDGHNYFSRSGPRLFDAIGILAHMLHPELFSQPLDPTLGCKVEVVEAEA
jgi:iron complex transport system substrate-binding protein